MSTTFDVFPGSRVVPTFAALLERATAELHRFLAAVGIRSRPPLRVRLLSREGDAALALSVDHSAAWGSGEYAWFTVGDLAGGTDGYFEDDPGEVKEYWDCAPGDPYRPDVAAVLPGCVAAGLRWTFRRSAGQPAAVNVAYGLIAGSLAAITGGLVHSIDCAWEGLPARGEEFLETYFRPERTADPGFRDWAGRCLGVLPRELGEG